MDGPPYSLSEPLTIRLYSTKKREPLGSLWAAFGLLWFLLGCPWGPWAGLRPPFGHPGIYGACLKFIKNTYDYRREALQFDVGNHDYRREM